MGNKYPQGGSSLNTNRADHRWWAIPPWLIIAAAVIVIPLFIFMTSEAIDRQERQITRLLVEKGAALIRSFEAGARTGIGLRWGIFQLQKLLMETAQQKDIDYLIVTDEKGTIIADSDPARIGLSYGLDLDLAAIAASQETAWRRVPQSEGADTFEVYRRFAPTGDRGPALFEPLPGAASGARDAEGFVIFVGLDMGPILAAHEEDRRHTLWMAGIFFLITVSGIVSLLLAQGYSAARTSLSRIKAFSDKVIESMPMGLVAADGQGRITVFNRTAETILHSNAAEIIGKRAAEILPPACAELLEEVAGGRRLIEKEIDCPVAEGRLVPLEVIATTLQGEDLPAAGTVLLFRDLTEVRRLKEEVARSQRLASLGSLAAGVAHEIRNPLSSIKGLATYFKERHREDPDDCETADVMIAEVERLNRVISQLLEFARPLEVRRVSYPLEAILLHSLKTVEAQLRQKGITLQTEISPGVGEIPVDPDRMNQVLLNLLLNALAAMDKGGVLTLSAKRHQEGTVQIVVSDTGSGISQEDLPRVFDPYFTTKPGGTGLGLPIVQKIVEAHGGQVAVSSREGQGTTVAITLPAKNEPQEVNR